MSKQTAALVTLLLVAVIHCGMGQSVYHIPFASSGNTIELAVANTATTPLADVKVTATDIPAWLRFAQTEDRIAVLKSEQEMPATFTFSVDKAAPVQRKHTLRFVITAPTGEAWTKEITIAVAPPERFALHQNFPNPFNPTTAISYQLPAPSGAEGSAVSRVSLKIFNLLGQEVESLVDGDRLPGYHQVMWDAARYSSGMYIYQLIATDERGQKQIARRRMMLLK